MKNLIFSLTLLLCSFFCLAQNFPALKPAEVRALQTSGYSVPLPSWLPEGFVLDTIVMDNLKGLPEEKALNITYIKALPDGTYQSFHIDAGFEGLGSLWFEGETIRSKAGKIFMYYQPMDGPESDESAEQLTDLIGTEWFLVNGLDFHVFCIIADPAKLSEDEIADMGKNYDPRVFVPIPKDEFRKILASLKVLKKKD